MKFRIFNNKEKKYVSNQNSFALRSDGALLGLYYGDEYVQKAHGYYTVEFCSNRQENMYGASNSEIWEGDILSIFFNNELERVGYVKYDEDTGAFVINKDNGGFEILSQYLVHMRVEITGTIHDEVSK